MNVCDEENEAELLTAEGNAVGLDVGLPEGASVGA